MDHNRQHIDNMLTDYLDGTLNQSDVAMVKAHLANCGMCRRELEELRLLIKKMDEYEVAVPSEELRKNFYRHLELEERSRDDRQITNRSGKSGAVMSARQFMRVAAVIALLIGSFYAGSYRQAKNSRKEIAVLTDTSREMKQIAMLSLLENKSASKRIQGVGYIEEFSEPEEAILQALIQRMRYDENTNVRLAATEALAGFRKSDMVRDAFIAALGTEKDPGIQIAMIKTLSDILDQKAIVPLKELMDNEETQPFVKAEIETLLPKFL